MGGFPVFSAIIISIENQTKQVGDYSQISRPLLSPRSSFPPPRSFPLILFILSSPSPIYLSLSPLPNTLLADFKMTTAYSSAKFVQPLSLNSTINGRSRDNSLFDPLKTGTSFLGSTRKLRVNSVHSNQGNVRRRLPVVAVSEVVKEKKVKSSSNLVTHSIFFTLLLPCSSANLPIASIFLLVTIYNNFNFFPFPETSLSFFFF